jgi:NodT family efflux transporter outer membrane factor (OMF) lipoprotein
MRIRSNALKGALLAAAAALAGCELGPDFARPAPPSASRYTRETLPPSTIAAEGKAQQFVPGVDPASDWWRLFKSDQLNAVVEQAVANNPTLQASEASLRASQDSLRAGYGVFFPKIDAEMSASRQRSAPQQQGLKGTGTVFNLVTLSGTISYPLDLFGGERRGVESLEALAHAQYYANKAAYLALTTNVVDACIARAAYSEQVRETGQLIDLELQQLHLAEVQAGAGRVSYVNVLAIRGLVAGNQALLAPLRQKLDQVEHLLAVLEGVPPSGATPPEVELSGLSLPTDLPVSLPSDLVRQRPDILEAEAQLHAASANIGVATAAMFPSISLSGAYGGAGSSFGRLSAANGRFWSVGPSATVPLFQGGSLWFARKEAIDAYQGAEANYRQVVLAAFAQVADALKALEHDSEGLQAQVEAQRAAGEALRLTQVNYGAGIAAFSDVLAADVQCHDAQIAYLQAAAQRQQDTVALFAAMGGGWWNARQAATGDAAP